MKKDKKVYAIFLILCQEHYYHKTYMKFIKCITKKTSWRKKTSNSKCKVKFDSAVLHLANIKCTLTLCKRLAYSTITTSDDCNGMCQQIYTER